MAHQSRRDLQSSPSEFRDYLTKIASLVSSCNSGEFRTKSRHFTRRGALSPEILLSMLLHLVADAGRRGYQNLIDAFWQQARDAGFELPSEEPVSAAAFCKARKKLSSQAVRHLLHLVADDFERRRGSRHRWKDMRVLAVDGSKFNLQRAPQLEQHFGYPSQANNPQALVCALYDVISGIPLDVTVAPNDGSERAELDSMLDRLSPGDLLVLDRGYPSFALMHELQQRGVHFLLRVSANRTFKKVESFIMDGGRDRHILLDPPEKSRHDGMQPIRVRAVHKKRDNDDNCLVFLTNLPKDIASSDEILELYGMRWKVEELFKIAKGLYLGQQQFHAKNPDGILQEIYAFATLVALIRTCADEAASRHQVPFQHVDQKASSLAVTENIVKLTILPARKLVDAFQLLLRRIARRSAPPRPGRAFPRRSYKPISKWNSTGKRRRAKTD